METRNDILKELQEIAPRLASVEKTNPYQLPENYFAQFQSSLMEKIKLGEVGAELKQVAPSLLQIEKAKTTEIPAAYFSGFSGKLIQKIRETEAANELAEIAPTLAGLEKVNLYQAPANYFNAFPVKVLNKVEQSQPVKAVAPQWIQTLNEALDRVISAVFKPKYSVAFAGITTSAIIAVMMIMKVQQCNDLDCRFAQLSTDDINNYLNNRTDAYKDDIFEETGNDNLSTNAVKSANENLYKDALKNVSDKALDEAILD
ncbi:MAG TPA: hypothetical protein VG603_09550 [Chitinophagales bacterium]|nr:hypothetical protein [Chitinophagales bacterium]